MSDRDAFRAEQQERRRVGKAKQHEKRLENATYTAAEVKVLTEAALRLGRKEAGEEIAQAINVARIAGRWNVVALAAAGECSSIALRIGSQPSPAASDATSRSGEGPWTSEPSKPAQTPQEPS